MRRIEATGESGQFRAGLAASESKGGDVARKK
jgi:hypothetical protein